jgi:hypothetical protein
MTDEEWCALVEKTFGDKPEKVQKSPRPEIGTKPLTLEQYKSLGYLMPQLGGMPKP